MDIDGYLGSLGSQGGIMGSLGYLWISMDEHGYSWISKNIWASWDPKLVMDISMDMHAYSLTDDDSG